MFLNFVIRANVKKMSYCAFNSGKNVILHLQISDNMASKQDKKIDKTEERIVAVEEAFSKTEQFIENGISEQDMVSMAGGLARQGLLPVVNSFASFLASRANEQIYNNKRRLQYIRYVQDHSQKLGQVRQAKSPPPPIQQLPGLQIRGH